LTTIKTRKDEYSKNRSDSMKSKQEYPLSKLTLVTALCAAGLFLLSGCTTQQQQQQRSTSDWSSSSKQYAAAPAAPAQPAAAPAAPKGTCDDPTWGLVKVDKTMPAEAAVGSEIKSEFNVTAQGCAGNVVVRDMVPANATYVRSEPAATVEGKQLTWRLGDMDAGASRKITVWLKPDQEGTIASCATVSADPRTCASTRVVRPALALTKTAPAEVTICDKIPVVLTVKNSGSSALTNVRVQDTLPEGLLSDGKRELSFDAGNMAPGESKQFKFEATASRPGRFSNVAQATSAQGVKAEANAATLVRQPVLAITCKAPDERYIGRPFEVCFNVVNKGDVASAATVVELALPNGITARSATAGGNVSSGKVTWDLGSLAGNTPKDLCVTLVGETPGSYNFAATTRGSCAKPVNTTCATRLVGISALLLEKADNPDPIAIGETTTYTVKVTNQGSADDTNVKMVVEFPAEITPVSASNGGTVQGKRVTFPPFPTLAPKQAFTYTIQAKGEKVGDARVRFIRTSDGIPAPTTAEESTRVY
jgi:uncharacterized repeat protein (TIGR01451 family)